MECLDNPVVTAFFKNEMYCDWCHALTIAYNELCLPREVVELAVLRMESKASLAHLN